MTPDEVVNGLLNLRKEVLGIDETAKNKFSIYNSAISLIQDYQKLRERIDREKIESIINDNCRYIADEGKVMFIYGNTAQAIITYLQQPTEH